MRLNDSAQPLATPQLIELARGCQVIVSDRATEGPAALFEQLPELVAFVRCAVDIRNVDVGAASAHGVLVTRASPGFVDAVAELAIGFMVDLARGVSDATTAYRAGVQPAVRMGRQLRGSTLGIIGYGHIGTRLAQLGDRARHAGARERPVRPGGRAASSSRPISAPCWPNPISWWCWRWPPRTRRT